MSEEYGYPSTRRSTSPLPLRKWRRAGRSSASERGAQIEGGEKRTSIRNLVEKIRSLFTSGQQNAICGCKCDPWTSSIFKFFDWRLLDFAALYATVRMFVVICPKPPVFVWSFIVFQVTKLWARSRVCSVGISGALLGVRKMSYIGTHSGTFHCDEVIFSPDFSRFFACS